jgi:hypothetical protein
LEHGGDVLVPQGGGRTGLAQETFSGFGASHGDAGPCDLQGNRSPERRVDRAIGRAHRSMAKLVKASILEALDLVNSEMPRSRRIVYFFSARIFTADPNP